MAKETDPSDRAVWELLLYVYRIHVSAGLMSGPGLARPSPIYDAPAPQSLGVAVVSSG